ncbi:MAG: hypothetical protein KGJ24_06025 [Burkholderiales bacterium]|nr:hypothetical protein [Burkholderiales bacterium]MDE2566194.1 hypothetical protein [Burkholderiales bacterium]
MQPAGPRSFSAGLLGSGMAGDRGARHASRQAFVELKQTYLHALDGLAQAEWLRLQVRAAEAPVDLWLLRAPVFAALGGGQPEQRRRRQLLRRGLDSAFPDLDDPVSAFTAF